MPGPPQIEQLHGAHIQAAAVTGQQAPATQPTVLVDAQTIGKPSNFFGDNDGGGSDGLTW